MERGGRIRRLREARKRTQKALALELGVSEKSVYDWEHGRPISWENVMRLAALYQVDPYELFDGTPRGAGDDEADTHRLSRAEADAASARVSSALILDELRALRDEARSLREDLRRQTAVLETLLQGVMELRQAGRSRAPRGTTSNPRPSRKANQSQG